MNDYKALIKRLRVAVDVHEVKGCVLEISAETCAEIADAIEELVRDINYCPTDTLRKYHAWLLEQFHNNPTSEILHSIDTAIGWLKAYAEYRDINVSFGVENAVDWNEIK
ncbi:MAG: hypothetical protein KBT06_08625 [Prevotellaceae bacterium]|nr:hypothetical protein [Candidatus Colivivens equi]